MRGLVGGLMRARWALRSARSWLRVRYVWLKPRPGDIYIATAAKAGTTWMQQIVFQLIHEGRGEFEHILQVSPFLEQLGTKPQAEQVLARLPSPRIFKTHLSHGLLRPPANSRVIYVTRAASDTLVSYYHHVCRAHGAHLDFDQFFQREMKNRGWSSHLRSWWPHSRAPNVLHVRYEDLVTDRERELRRVATFLALPLPPERLPDILEKTSFEYMKRHNARFAPPMPGGLSAEGFIREGKVGSGRDALDAGQQALLEKTLAPLFRELGITGNEV
ncbi:sulfotransferase domain-containing protein [Myxococcus sp. CA056]|uniref:sulfotransferase domain-containing protein n=1 Tax=Myxococcus sp. CA056 TaxID=2741740 RepID=UPI00157B4E33|nr:sulfotransferase domain-containing protein [Myxococcus sp. CA056]